MVCPNCGNTLADDSTNCFLCGTSFVNPNSSNTNNSNNSGYVNFSVPQDFKLAGDREDLGLDDLPSALATALNNNNQKQEKTKKKRKKGLLKKIIKPVLKVLIAAVVVFIIYKIVISFTTSSAELICTYKGENGDVLFENKNEFVTSKGGHMNSLETVTIYRKNFMPFTQEEAEARLNEFSDELYDKTVEIIDEKIVIKYYLSYYKIKSVPDMINLKTSNGYTCEIPKSGFKLPFLK